MTKRELHRLGKGMAFLSPWMIGFVLFSLLPISLLFYYSFCRYTLLQPPHWVGSRNYTALLHDKVFWQAVRNTFSYAAMAIPAGLLVSLGLAMLLDLELPGRAVWRTIVFVPSLVPVVPAAMLWMWLYNGRLGLINLLLGKVGIAGPAWLGDPRWALPALALMSVWGVGNTVVIFLAGLQDMPRELYEAAELDGAGVVRRI